MIHRSSPKERESFKICRCYHNKGDVRLQIDTFHLHLIKAYCNSIRSENSYILLTVDEALFSAVCNYTWLSYLLEDCCVYFNFILTYTYFNFSLLLFLSFLHLSRCNDFPFCSCCRCNAAHNIYIQLGSVCRVAPSEAHFLKSLHGDCCIIIQPNYNLIIVLIALCASILPMKQICHSWLPHFSHRWKSTCSSLSSCWNYNKITINSSIRCKGEREGIEAESYILAIFAVDLATCLLHIGLYNNKILLLFQKGRFLLQHLEHSL